MNYENGQKINAFRIYRIQMAPENISIILNECIDLHSFTKSFDQGYELDTFWLYAY
jgi:hypothetical protein